MTDEKIVKALKSIDYEPFQDDAESDEVKEYKKYCVYYNDTIEKQDQKIIHRIIEFVFINETEDFDEIKIIAALEETGLTFKGGKFGRMKKVAGGDVVNSLTLRFARPRKMICIY